MFFFAFGVSGLVSSVLPSSQEIGRNNLFTPVEWDAEVGN